MQVRQVATLLGYGEPQVLEVFKNMLPTKLYWILFPIEDVRQAVETAKRILTKEKLDKQLTGQTPLAQSVVGQTVETEDGMEIIDFGKTIETTIFEGTLEDTEDKIVEENMGIISAMIIIEAGIG